MKDQQVIQLCEEVDKEMAQLRAELKAAKARAAQLAAALRNIAVGNCQGTPLVCSCDQHQALRALAGNSTALRDLLIPLADKLEASKATTTSWHAAMVIVAEVERSLRSLCEGGAK